MSGSERAGKDHGEAELEDVQPGSDEAPTPPLADPNPSSLHVLDRALQRHLLEELAKVYPGALSQEKLLVWALITSGGRALIVNLAYLSDHGLVRAELVEYGSGTTVKQARITAKGLDFLQNDGGLSAVLGVVTVKFHDETIRQLLLAKVDQSDADPTVKARLMEAIRALPAEGLKTTTLSLLEAGLDRLPDAVPLLQRWLGLG